MKNEKYVYNPVTLRYEKVEVPLKSRIFKTIAYAIAVIVTGFVFYVGIDRLIISPQEKIQKRVIEDMSLHLAEQTKFIDKLSVEIDDLQEKDANVHRIIFGMDPIDEAIWNGGIGGDNPYRYLENSAEVTEQLESYLSKAKKLERKVNLQKQSLDTLHYLAAERETRLASIPSIKPIREDKLKKKLGALSGYGIRLHPVHKVKKHHAGIDFTAPRGTAIIATGNGTVIRVENKGSGYGKNVIVDHGYGFTTLYAHMYSISVKKGDVLTKGQQLGTVGSTGTSTAPHLHYEVRVNGKAINPIDYVLDGLTPTEYQELVNKAGIANQSFD
jgi:uncharacterized coiled-coil protein SlyX